MDGEKSFTRAAEQLWIPGQPLDDFPALSPDELHEQFRLMCHADAKVANLDVLSAVRIPNEGEIVKGVVSIDLCEVLRQTTRGLALFGGKEGYASSDYVNALWQREQREDDAYLQCTIESLVKIMMNHDLVQPVDDIDTIAGYMRQWRERGVYCIANTSTTFGCEAATLRFLQTHTPDCFDGIVFPRNPDGRGKTTKAEALRQVLSQLDEYGHAPDYALHIDDTTHHIASMIAQPPHERMHYFAPAYPENVAIMSLANNVTRSRTPLESFAAMHDYITSWPGENMYTLPR